MAVPKRRTSKAKKRSRRAHDALGAPNTTICMKCGESKLPHRICTYCGVYKDRQVVVIEQDSLV